MQVDDALRALETPLDIEALTPPLREALHRRLADCDYREAAVSARLAISDISEIQAAHLPMYLGIRLGAHPLDRLIRLFLLGQAETTEPLGDEIAEGLIHCRVLRREGERVRCPYALFPCIGRLILTDALITRKYHRRHVMPLGGDSYALARSIVPLSLAEGSAPTEAPAASSASEPVPQKRTPGTVLDVCTGSGVQAIVAARGASRVVAVDVNPRALHFVAFNARLNEVEVTPLLGSVYEPLDDQDRFDRILANPPFVPTPDRSLPLYRGGGESGEDVLIPLVAGLRDRLESEGMAQIYSVMVADKGQSFSAKIAGWLGDLPHGVLATAFSRRSPEEFALNHLIDMEEAWELERFQARLEAWVGSFRRQGFDAITEGVIHIRRLLPGRASWACERLLQRPTTPYPERIRRFFANTDRLQTPGALERWTPQLAANVRAVWRGRDARGGVLHAITYQRDDWNLDRELDGDQFALLDGLQARQTVSRMREEWKGTRPFDELLAWAISVEAIE
jgi:carbamoyltransferase